MNDSAASTAGDEFAHVTNPGPRMTLASRVRVLIGKGFADQSARQRKGWSSRPPPEQFGKVIARVLAAALAFAVVVGFGAFLDSRVIAPRRSSLSVATTDGFPREAVGAFAARFAQAYLTYDPAKQQDWQNAVQSYMAVGADATNLKWDGKGKQSVFVALPAGVEVRDRHHAVATVTTLVDGGRWLCLAVPVVTDNGTGMGVSAPPAFVPCPSGATVGEQNTTAMQRDQVLEQSLKPNLSAFFAAYAASDGTQLGYYSTGTQFVGLNGAMLFDPNKSLQDLQVEVGRSDRRNAVAVVWWTDKASGASFVQSYRLVLVQVGGKWLVQSLAPQNQ